MIRRFAIAILSIASQFVVMSTSAVLAESKDWEQVALSETLGLEIDAEERKAYQLLPDVDGFLSARFLLKGESKYRMEYTHRDASGEHSRSKRISSDIWELTKLHVTLVEKYREQQAAPLEEGEASSHYRMALKYAARGRYDFSRVLLTDLLREFPSSSAAALAEEDSESVHILARTRRALFLPGALYDRSGRTDLLIFAGYYGMWVGIAAPVYFEADDPQWYALGLLTGAPASLYFTSQSTKNADIGSGRASMISLGGHLGTWQGLGWPALADWDAEDVVGASLLGGLTGIAVAVLLTQDIHITEGHGSMAGSALPWGTWFGLVIAAVADMEDDDVLSAALIGSDALVLGTVLGARNVRMSRARVRLISMMGVVGTVAGFGLDLLAQVDEASTAMAIAGLGSVGGLAAGAHMTRDYDRGKDLASHSLKSAPTRWSVAPQVGLVKHPFRTGQVMPELSVRLSF
jgi:hypothetical protein